jgi:hypothetical protein
MRMRSTEAQLSAARASLQQTCSPRAIEPPGHDKKLRFRGVAVVGFRVAAYRDQRGLDAQKVPGREGGAAAV